VSDKEKEIERLKKEIEGEIAKISIYDEIRIYLSLISKNIINYEWDKALENIRGFHSKLLSIFLNRGIDVSILNNMFDELVNTVKSPYDAIGNNLLKRDDCFEQLNEIINYIGNCGVYIGQQNVFVVNYVDVLNEKVKELTRMIYDATTHASMRENFIMTCEFIRDNIIPYMEVPSEMIRYKISESLNTIISSLPLPSSRGTSSTSKIFEDAFSKLRNYVDIVVLSSKNPEFKKFFDTHKVEFENATVSQIEKTVEKMIKKLLGEVQGE